MIDEYPDPVERFNGRAREAAAALEQVQQAALKKDPRGDESVSMGDSAVLTLIAMPRPQGGKASTLGRPLPTSDTPE